MEPLLRDPNKSPSMDELHLLIMSMDDEISGYRWREAIWLSVLFHVVVALAVLTAPRWLPKDMFLTAVLKPSHDNTTFVVMPTDHTRAPRPKTDMTSDKDRIAQSRMPTPSRAAVRQPSVQKPGAPTPSAPPPPQGIQQAQQQPPPGGGEAQPQQQQPATQIAQAQPPPQGPGSSPFKTGMSPGSAIEQSMRSIAAGHGATHISFGGGDYGVNRPDPHTDVRGDVDILSDTMGVDFGPYLQRALFVLRKNWISVIPESIFNKKGKVTFEFAILKNGQVAGLRLVSTSGDQALDRAAHGGITLTDPFPALPPEFRGQFLQLRIKFYYNPNTGELE